jgi:hypothetical protein
MAKLTGITLQLKKTPFLDKSGKVQKDPSGEKLYSQHDSVALMSLLDAIDFTKYSMKEWRLAVKLRDKIEDAWRREAKNIELTLDEAAFLKDFLFNLKDKLQAGTRITPFVLRTVVAISEQLE